MAIHFHDRPSLVAYVTCGDPDLTTTREIVLAALAAGASVVELGVPFSDPVADGVVIQRASERALKNGTTLSDVLKLAREVRKQQAQAGLIVFSYLNPVLRLGLERFAGEAAEAGVDGALITDLTVEEAGEYRGAMQAQRLETVFLAAPTSTEARLKRIAEASSGFVYAVSRTGVTGKRQELAGEARALVDRLRKFTKLPIAVGFGISTAEQFRAVGEFADAGVVGSAVVETIERAGRERAAEAVGEFVRTLKHSAISTQHSASAEDD
jgi:tryptophan synthase alpha chain